MMAVRQRSAGPRRTRTWVRDYGSLTTTGTPVQVAPLVGWETVNGKVEKGSTIGRMLLTCSLQRSVGTTDDPPAILAGLRVGARNVDADDQDVSAETTTAQLDWMWWHKLYLVGDGASPSTTWRRSFEFDIRAMRVIPSLEHTLFLVIADPFGAVDDYVLSYGISVLLLEPA